MFKVFQGKRSHEIIALQRQRARLAQELCDWEQVAFRHQRNGFMISYMEAKAACLTAEDLIRDIDEQLTRLR